jgi:hypothetical protein
VIALIGGAVHRFSCLEPKSGHLPGAVRDARNAKFDRGEDVRNQEGIRRRETLSEILAKRFQVTQGTIASGDQKVLEARLRGFI